MDLKVFVIAMLILRVKSHWNFELKNSNPAFDPKFYEDVLDAKQCQQQLEHILKENGLLKLQFLDASAKLPRNMLGGNLLDLGNYHQCLSIYHIIDDKAIKGKYCSILIHFENISNPSFDNKVNEALPKLTSERGRLLKQGLSSLRLMKEYNAKIRMVESVGDFYNGNFTSNEEISSIDLAIRLGICIPKVCSTHQILNSSFLYNTTGFIYSEDFCRLPHDKPWSPADTTAAFVFSIIGILTVLCTAYDVTQRFIFKRDTSVINSHLQTFSVYTNGCRIASFTSGPATLHCLDGIRVLATAWVVLGHTTYTQLKLLNILDILTWGRSLDAIYIIAAPITVDTFFTVGGILLVYTNCGKISGRQLLKNLPLFYLNRLLRMFPLLATVVLLQASFFHRFSDGPMWKTVATETNRCRTHWWITLLYMQNYINASKMCLGHTWYLAIDVQLYIISPLALFWILGGSKKTAWLALTGSLLTALTAATIYNFYNNFLAHSVAPLKRVGDMGDYMEYYYTNTVTRASPFFVGMTFGYLLSICKGKQVQLSWPSVALFWSSQAIVMTIIFFSAYFVIQDDWDHQFVNNILNSFMRPAWSMAIGWMVFACVHGYGGPLNWFLSLDMWRLPARLCYGVYLFHYPFIFTVCDSVVGLVYFSPSRLVFFFVAYLSISFFVSYFATLLIDAPFSTIFKWLVATQSKKKPVG